MESIALGAFARIEPRIPIQPIPHGRGSGGVLLAFRVGIGLHSVERNPGHSKRGRLVEVHVFHESVGIEKIISFPVRRKRRQSVGAEFCIDFLSAAEDDKSIVDLLQQRRAISIARVFAALPRKRAGAADSIIAVRQISRSFAFDLLRIATKFEGRNCPRQLCLANFARSVRAVVDENLETSPPPPAIGTKTPCERVRARSRNPMPKVAGPMRKPSDTKSTRHEALDRWGQLCWGEAVDESKKFPASVSWSMGRCVTMNIAAISTRPPRSNWQCESRHPAIVVLRPYFRATEQ